MATYRALLRTPVRSNPLASSVEISDLKEVRSFRGLNVRADILCISGLLTDKCELCACIDHNEATVRAD